MSLYKTKLVRNSCRLFSNVSSKEQVLIVIIIIILAEHLQIATFRADQYLWKLEFDHFGNAMHSRLEESPVTSPRTHAWPNQLYASRRKPLNCFVTVGRWGGIREINGIYILIAWGFSESLFFKTASFLKRLHSYIQLTPALYIAEKNSECSRWLRTRKLNKERRKNNRVCLLGAPLTHH